MSARADGVRDCGELWASSRGVEAESPPSPHLPLRAWSPEPAGLSRRLSEEELTRVLDEMEPPRAPAAGPSLVDIGAIYSCLQWARMEADGMRGLLDDLDRHLDQLDSMRLDLEKAEGGDDA